MAQYTRHRAVDTNTLVPWGDRTPFNFPLRRHLIRQSDELRVREDAISTSTQWPDVVRSLPDPQYHLAHPVEVIVIPNGDLLIATEHIFLRYGVGRTVKEAKDDYAASLLDYYEDLMEFDGRLSAQLQEDLDTLRTFIVIQETE